MSSYPVKENPIVSAVSEILRYKHTDKHTDTHTQTSCYFIIRIALHTIKQHIKFKGHCMAYEVNSTTRIIHQFLKEYLLFRIPEWWIINLATIR